MFNSNLVLHCLKQHKFINKSFKAKLKAKKPIDYYFAFEEERATLLPGEDDNTSNFEKMMNRFPPEEIAKNPNTAAWYAMEQLKPFPEGEVAIARSPQSTESYCINVLYRYDNQPSALSERWQYEWAVGKGFKGSFRMWLNEKNL